MSECIITRRGGSGGLSTNKAVIHVTAPAGSTITFSKGGVIVKTLGPEKSHVNADDNTFADWYYAVSAGNYGTWTVTATLGTDTASDTIIIDSNKQYDSKLWYRTFLFNDGVILADLGEFKNISSVSISNNTITAILNGNNGNYFGFQYPIVFKDFGNSLHVLISQTDTAQTQMTTRIGAFSSLPVSGSYFNNTSKVVAGTQYADKDGVYRELSVDISSLTPGSYYYLAGMGVASFTVTKIWIEP